MDALWGDSVKVHSSYNDRLGGSSVLKGFAVCKKSTARDSSACLKYYLFSGYTVDQCRMNMRTYL